jgi:quinol-cytochrome oxidoreductase complex cytochrome b subunit
MEFSHICHPTEEIIPIPHWYFLFQYTLLYQTSAESGTVEWHLTWGLHLKDSTLFLLLLFINCNWAYARWWCLQ